MDSSTSPLRQIIRSCIVSHEHYMVGHRSYLQQSGEDVICQG